MRVERKQFDWQEIHAELDRRLAHLGSTMEDDPARVRALLKVRSVAVAAVPHADAAATRLTRAVVFRLAKERYALRLDRAREIAVVSHCVPLPGSEPEILGVANWRGEIVVLCDLARLLKLPAPGEGARRWMIVLKGEEPLIALTVDAVDEVVQLDMAALRANAQPRATTPGLFRGVTSGAVAVLDEDALEASLAAVVRAA